MELVLPMAEFAIINKVHASTLHTLFYANGLIHIRTPTLVKTEYTFRGEVGLIRVYTNWPLLCIDRNVISYDAYVENVINEMK